MDMDVTTMTNETLRTRAPKIKYRFEERRHGDVVMVRTAKARVYYLSAFLNWMRDRPGTLQAVSRKADGGFYIRFAGISPAEMAGVKTDPQGKDGGGVKNI